MKWKRRKWMLQITYSTSVTCKHCRFSASPDQRLPLSSTSNCIIPTLRPKFSEWPFHSLTVLLRVDCQTIWELCIFLLSSDVWNFWLSCCLHPAELIVKGAWCLYMCRRQTYFKSLLLLPLYSDSHETWHTCSICQYAQIYTTDFRLKIFGEFLKFGLCLWNSSSRAV